MQSPATADTIADRRGTKNLPTVNE
jgi:hypothetical protein